MLATTIGEVNVRVLLSLATFVLGITSSIATAQAPPPLVDTHVGGVSVGDFPVLDAPVENTSLEARIAQLESQLGGLQNALCTSQSCRKSKCDGSCQDNGGFESGFSIVFAKPHLKESFEATVADVATGSLDLIPFEFDHDITPRVWFGYFNEKGLGVRARYWQYDHNAAPLALTATPTTFPSVSSISVIFPAAISTAAPGDLLSVRSGLQIHTVDIEGAQKANLFGVDLVASAGVRYASLQQHFNSTVTRGPFQIGTLDWIREFEGAGLTVGGEANKPLGGSALSAFGTARGSLLFGRKTLQRTTVGDITPATAAAPPNVILDDADEVSAIFSLTGGLQWTRRTPMGDVFFRGTYETQLWTAAGAPTLTFLGFEGIGLSLGLTR